jgi:hypothetical protein
VKSLARNWKINAEKWLGERRELLMTMAGIIGAALALAPRPTITRLEGYSCRQNEEAHQAAFAGGKPGESSP